MPEENHELERRRAHYELIRSYTTLVVGVGMIVYGVWPPTDPAVFTFGGCLIGVMPTGRAAL